MTVAAGRPGRRHAARRRVAAHDTRRHREKRQPTFRLSVDAARFHPVSGARTVSPLASLPPPPSEHRPLTYLILIADGVHNFIGGLAMAGAFLIDVRVGISTWIPPRPMKCRRSWATLACSFTAAGTKAERCSTSRGEVIALQNGIKERGVVVDIFLPHVKDIFPIVERFDSFIFHAASIYGHRKARGTGDFGFLHLLGPHRPSL